MVFLALDEMFVLLFSSFTWAYLINHECDFSKRRRDISLLIIDKRRS